MAKTNHKIGSTISVESDPEELRIILDRIDEHLAFHQVINNDTHVVGDKLPKTELPSLDKLVAISDWLKISSAPLHPSIGIRGVRGLLLRFLNLPIRIFGTEQINFNRKLREFIGELMITIHSFNSILTNLSFSILSIDRKLGSISDLSTKEPILETSNLQYNEEIKNKEDIKRLVEQVEALRQELDRLKIAR